MNALHKSHRRFCAVKSAPIGNGSVVVEQWLAEGLFVLQGQCLAHCFIKRLSEKYKECIFDRHRLFLPYFTLSFLKSLRHSSHSGTRRHTDSSALNAKSP